MKRIKFSSQLMWLLLIMLLFATVFQWFYFSIVATQIRTEMADQQQQMVELTKKTETTLGADTADALEKQQEKQQELIQDLNKKFATYDKSLETIAAAIGNLQKQIEDIIKVLKR